MGQQATVSIKEPDRELAIWASLNLFLVQVDLQMIKEIKDHFPESEFTLKDIVKIRSRTKTVEDAINYLQRKIAIRRKLDEPQGGEASSHGHTKETHTGRIDTFQNIQPDVRRSGATASADQNTSRPPKRSVLSKSRVDVASDTDDSSTGSVVNKRNPSAGAPSEYNVPLENFGGQYLPNIDTNQLGQVHVTDHDLYGVSPEESQPSGAKSYNVDAHYDTVPPTGPPQYLDNTKGSQTYGAKQHGLDARRHTVPQVGPSQYSGNTKASQTYGTKQHGLDARYHTVPQVGPPHQYLDNIKGRIDTAVTTSHSLSHPGTGARLYSSHFSSISGFPRQGSPGYDVVARSEVMHPSNKVITDTNGHQSRSETHKIGSAAGDDRYANLRDINSSARQQFGSNDSNKSMSTKDSTRLPDYKGMKVGQTRGSCAEPMEVEQRGYSRGSRSDVTSSSNGMTEGAYATPTGQSGVTDVNTTLKQRRQCDSPSIANTQEATRSRGGATTEAQPTRLLYQPENNFTSTKEAAHNTRPSVANVKNHTAEKVEMEGSSPVTKRKTSVQKDRAQNPGHSSRNEISQEGNMFHKDVKRDSAICEQCMLHGANMCKNCFRISCVNCKGIYLKDLCDKTKGQHVFVDLKSKQTQERKSELSSQNYENVDEDREDWSCSRCTFLNPPDHKICAICAATRGVGALELAPAGSRVCKECTYHNNEYTKVCISCHKTLDLANPETSV